jgi:phosphatidylglycerol:prolipoprotein diacylglycerol transferase
MLPNLYIPPIEIGPLRIGPFPILAAIAVLVCCELAYQRAKRTGLNTMIMVDGLLWSLVVGFAMAHWVDVIFYHPDKVLKNPLILLMIWTGLSSFGGFFGGLLGAVIYFRRKNVSFSEYLDAVMFGSCPAWIIARLGCSIVFDHPGLTTDFFLGMVDNYGVVRHNLGFYEMLLAIAVTTIIYATRNVRSFKGFHFVLVIFMYAPVRFLLDFLRVADKTYWGLTPGQYGAIALLILGSFLVIRGLKKEPHDVEILTINNNTH